jgi:hypothetical protein
MSGVDFSPEHLAELRRGLGLPPDAAEERVQVGLMLAFGMADQLTAEVDRVLTDELLYLGTALRVGWAHWVIDGT